MVNILVVGCSDIFIRRALPALQKIQSCKFIDVASKTKTRDILNNEIKIRNFYSSYEQAIINTDASWVYISIINSEHESIAQFALKYKKNIIIDKPAVLTVSGAEKLIDEAKRNGVFVVEAALFQYHPQIQTIKKEIHNCRIGRISSFFTIPPLSKFNFRNNHKLGGGAIFDMGAYVFGLGRELWGVEPKSILSTIVNSDGSLVTAFSVLLNYGRGKSLVGHFGFDSQYLNRATIVTEYKIIDIDRIFTIPGDYENNIIVKKGNDIKKLKCPKSDPFENFFNLVLEQKLNFKKHSDNLLRNAEGIAKIMELIK